MLEFHDSADDQSADVKPGESFAVSLHENPTTGFRWKLAARGEPVCTLTDDDFQPGLAPGAQGMHRWRFRAARPGETTIRLILERPWAHAAQPAKAFSVRVRVNP
jgi:predicted secreted protein